MGIEFAVHTYGHGEVMFYVLNGIQMIMASDFTGAMIKLIALVATSYYSLQGIARANEGRVGYYLMKTVGMLVVITSLVMPKADILIVDRIGLKPPKKVDNLPYAFVLPVGILEAIGAGITSMFEQAFSAVSSVAFKDYGLVFGQRMVQESRHWRISNPEFASNMNTFIKRCVVLESMIGGRFTPQDVFSTDDIFTLVTDNTGTFRTVDLTINKQFKRLTCKDAGRELKNYMQPELQKLLLKYKNTDFGTAVCNVAYNANPTFNDVLGKNIELGYKSTFGVDYSAAEIVRQNMMINAIADFNKTSDLYGYTRASDMQKSNWKISGDLAKEYLPQFLTVIKCLIYASFIFVVPMMILSGGLGHYMKYCVVVFSLQIWPALNSVLNLFIELYSRARLSGIAYGGLSFATFNQAHEVVDSIVLIASGLQFCIPFLSFAIVRGGVESFVHLASSLQGASNNAAASASSELTSGNRNLDNISQDNASIHNKSGFKTDLNLLTQERAMQVQRSDGSFEKTFADGSSSITSGAGVNKSSGTTSLIMEEGMNAGMIEGYNESVNSLKGMEQHYQKSKSESISSTTERISNLAQKQAAGQNLSIDSSTEEGQTLQQAVNNAVSFHDRDGYGWNQAASASINAYAGIGAGIGMKIEGASRAENTNNQSLDKSRDVTKTNGTSNSLNTLLRAAGNVHCSMDDSIDKSLMQNARASYDKMQSYGESISQKQEEVESYSKALQAHQSKGASARHDVTHEVESQIAKEYGVSQADAHQMLEMGDKRAKKVWDNIVQAEIAKELEQVKGSESSVNDIASMNAQAFKNEYSGNITNQAQNDLQKQAAQDGLDQNLIQTRIDQSQGKISNTNANMTQNANDQIHSIKHHNEVLEQGMDGKIKEYEEDRIGQGRISTTLGKATKHIFGTSNIGGLPNKEKALEYLKENKNTSQTPNIKPLKPTDDK